jgi:ketosteroid isomerase-like protein
MQVIDLAAEAAAIRQTAADDAAATSQGGVEGARAYASYATTDARWLPPEAPMIEGREAIAQYVAAFTHLPNLRVSWDHLTLSWQPAATSRIPWAPIKAAATMQRAGL